MENCDWIFALLCFYFHHTNGSTQTPVIFSLEFFDVLPSVSSTHELEIWWLLQILHEPNSRCNFASSHPHLQIPVHFGHKYLVLAVMCNHISLRKPLPFCVNSIFHIYSLTQHNTRICLSKAHMSATAQQSPPVQSWFYSAMIHPSSCQKAHIIFSRKNEKNKTKHGYQTSVSTDYWCIDHENSAQHPPSPWLSILVFFYTSRHGKSSMASPHALIKYCDDELCISITQQEITKPADRKQPEHGILKHQDVYDDCTLGDICYW